MAALLPGPTGIDDLADFLRRLGELSARSPGASRAWGFPPPACAPVRSLEARLGGRGPAATSLDGIEGPIRSAADAEAVSRRIAERATSLLPTLPSGHLHGLTFAARELAANVALHARAGETGFASVARDRGGLVLWVSDCGIGIERSLRERPELAGRVTDAAGAVAIALQRSLGAPLPPGPSGTGLPFVASFCQAAGGEFAIVTGRVLWRRRVVAGGAYPSFVEAVEPWEGTIVAVRVPGGAP